MKKISLALATAGLTASLGVYAALPTDAQPYQIVVPNLKSGIDITLEGLYLQPSNSNLDYANVQTFSGAFNDDSIVLNNTSNLQTVDPDYNFGFRVGLGYTFPDSGNDVQLAWTHFNHSDSNSTTAPSNSLLTSTLGHTNFVNGPFDDEEKLFGLAFGLPIYDEASVTSDVKFRVDSIDLDVGQFVDIGTRLRMRMFAGLRFAQVKNDQTATTNASGSLTVDVGDEEDLIIDYTDTNIEQFNSKFTGIGPRFGIDSSYHIGNCFGVVGHAAMALLVGQVDSNTTANDTFFASVNVIDNDGDLEFSDEFTLDTNTNINSDNVTRVVPAFDAKLGLNWSYIFTNESVLTIEGGYQVTQYIDAVDKLTVDDFNNVVRTSSSVGFAGPYLTLNWSI